MNIITLKGLLGHENIETTLAYLHIAQLQSQKVFSPLDTLFAHADLTGTTNLIEIMLDKNAFPRYLSAR